MAMISGCLVVAVVCAFSLCVGAWAGLDPALLPLPALACAVVVLAVAGMGGALPVGLWLVLGALTAAAVFAGVRAGAGAVKQAAGSPALGLFAGGSVFFWLWFAIKQPMFTQWDEFTAWGVAPKMVKVMNALYAAQPYSFTASHTYPGTSLVSYLFQAFSPQFTEWACLAALNTLLLACVAAAAAAAKPGRGWPNSVLAFAGGVLLPLLFNSVPIGTVSPVYQSAMADIPMGFVFGGVLCTYYNGRAQGRGVGVLLAAAPLALLTLLKDITFAYGLIAAFVIAVDLLAGADRAWLRTLAKAAAGFVLAALPVLAAFLGWNRYVAAVDPGSGAATVGHEGLGYADVLLGGVRQLLGLQREEKFGQLMALMGRAFVERRVFLAGSGAVACAALLALALAACLARPGGAGRWRPLLAWGALAACFAALYAFHLILYHYNFAENEAMILKDYERYLSPYYTGWWLALLCLLGQSVPEGRRRGALLQAAVTAATVVLVVWRGVPVAGFWSRTDGLYAQRLDVQQRAAAFSQELDWPDRVLVLIQGDNGTRWYYYKYELTATVVNGWGWNGGYGDFMNVVPSLGDATYESPSPGDFNKLMSHITQNDIRYLLVERSDAYLASLLQQGMETPVLTGFEEPTLYRVEQTDRGVQFTPVMVVERAVKEP